MAAPSVRNSGTALFGTASTLTPVIPGHATDDILLFWAASSANASVTPTHSTPTGFTLLASAVITTGVTRSQISCYWKRAASGSEVDQSITFTPTGATACHHMAVVQSVQGCVTSGNPYENAQTNQAAGASSIGVTRTVSGADRLSFIAAHHADNVATAATEDRSEAYVQHYSTDNGTGIDGFTAVWSFGPLGSTADTATMAFTSGGTGVGIAGLAFALLAPTEIEGTGRFAGTAMLEKTVAARFASTATLEKTVAVRFAGTATLERTATGRFAGTANLALEGSGRFAGTALLEAVIGARFAGTANLEATSVGRLAGTATLEKEAGARFAGVAQLEKILTARLAGTAELERTLTTRLAGIADLAPSGITETARFAGTATLERTATARLAGVALLERMVAARFAGTANLSGAGFESSGRFAGVAWLRRTPTYESSASSPTDAAEAAGPSGVVGSLASEAGTRDAGAKAR